MTVPDGARPPRGPPGGGGAPGVGGRPGGAGVPGLGGGAALGAATRVPDPWGDVGGDVLYAVATFVLVVLVAPRVRPLVPGAVAPGWCWAVEALQATGVAAAVNDAVPPAAWLLGSTFAVRDLVCYLVGVALACAVDAGVGARSATPRRPRTSG